MVDNGATDRRTRILLVAEELFAEHGFEAVSMRDISDAAGVSVALLTYHYTTKDNLYRTIFARRKGVLHERIRRLREVDTSAPDALRQIVAAFVEPQMALRATPEGLSFARLLAREASDPSSETRGIIEEFYDPMAREFISALQEALPEVPAERLRWDYLFAVGAMSMSVFDQRVGRFGGHPEPHLPEKTTMLKEFILAGLAGSGPTGPSTVGEGPVGANPKHPGTRGPTQAAFKDDDRDQDSERCS